MNQHVGPRFEKLADHFGRILAAVPVDRWDAPSPCDGWTARDIVEHVVTTQRDFLTGQPFAPDQIAVADPLEAWPVVRALVSAALADPSTANHPYDGYFGPTTFAQTIDDFYSLDLVVHSWDLATAVGLEDLRSIDPSEMVAVRASLAKVGDMLRQPGLFGPEVRVADSADEQTKFLAYVGRVSPS